MILTPGKLTTPQISIEMRDEDREHGKNVGNLSFIIAKSMGLDICTCYDIYVAGYLHDVGKRRLNPKVLNKPGILTHKEKAYINKHVEYSLMEAFIAGYNNDILRMIFHHHENNDGTGYPRGLSGEHIPMGARILRVADFFDALVSDRCYKKKKSPREAMKTMEDNCNQIDLKIYSYLENIIKENLKKAKHKI